VRRCRICNVCQPRNKHAGEEDGTHTKPSATRTEKSCVRRMSCRFLSAAVVLRIRQRLRTTRMVVQRESESAVMHVMAPTAGDRKFLWKHDEYEIPTMG
jgi:hypothetical protein